MSEIHKVEGELTDYCKFKMLLALLYDGINFIFLLTKRT